MKCPYCNQKLKIGLRLLFSQKCVNCDMKISELNKKRYSIYSGINVIISLIIYTLIRSYGNIWGINSIIFEIISIIGAFIILGILELILLVNFATIMRINKKQNRIS